MKLYFIDNTINSSSSFQNRFVSHMYAMLKDSDARVRNEAANAINEFNVLQGTHKNKRPKLFSKNNLVTEFVAETLSNDVPFSIDNLSGHGFQPTIHLNSCNELEMKKVLGKHLFDITNMLFDLKSSEQLVSIREKSQMDF